MVLVCDSIWFSAWFCIINCCCICMFCATAFCRKACWYASCESTLNKDNKYCDWTKHDDSYLMLETPPPGDMGVDVAAGAG